MPDYLAAPPINYMDTRMRVGILVDAFANNTGPQRDRWTDKPDYKQALKKGVAWYLCSKYYDREAVIRAVRTFKTAVDLAEGSYGGAGGELRVKEKLEEVMGR